MSPSAPPSPKAKSHSASRDRLVLELKRAAGPGLLYIVLVIAGIATAADIISNLTGTKPWQSYAIYHAQFTDVKGVIPGSTSLREAGVEVGTVTGSKIVNGEPVLTLSLEKKYAPLYKNAHIVIRPVTPLEDMYVDITSRGTPSHGELSKDAILPASSTESPVEVGEVLDIFQPTTRTYLADLLNQLGAGLGGDGGQELKQSFIAIAPFLKNAQLVSSALTARKADLASLVHTFGGITQELADRDVQLQGFVDHANTVLASLNRTSAPFSSTITELPGTLSGMTDAFQKLRSAESTLDPALQKLGPVADVLPSGLKALGRFSQEATPALVALRPGVKSLKPLAVTLKPTAQSLSNAFGQLNQETGQINKITALATQGNCLDLTSKFLANVMSLAKFAQGDGAQAQGRADLTINFTDTSQSAQDQSTSPLHETPLCYANGG